MDDSFFRSYRAKPTEHPRYTPTVRGIPVYSAQPTVQHHKPPAKTTVTTPKVVQIPVHFVRSEPSRSASALKIQKVFRGFLVRRSVKRIMSIRREVDEIERRLSRIEEVELIRRDQRERLRINEMLMALLFKLDSVRGVDSGVRECRRAVIKKAIALQERVDAIVSSASDKIDAETLMELKDDDDHGCTEAVDLTPGSTAEDPVKSGHQISDSFHPDADNGSDQSTKGKNTAGEEEFENKPLNEIRLSEDGTNVEDLFAENCKEEEVGADLQVNAEEAEEKVVEICKEEDFSVHSDVEVDEENCIEKGIDENLQRHDCLEVEADLEMKGKEEEWCVEKGKYEFKTRAVSECLEESMETSGMQNGTEGGEVNDVSEMGMDEKEGTDDDKRNRELLERMMEDNEKMMNLMAKLCQKNEMQTRMLNALTHRVEQLEKAFICDRIRRKKKRHSA